MDTSGYAFKLWKGPFYPVGLPDKEMLSFYACRFDSVEINHRLHRMPVESVFAHWRGRVPKDFYFSVKAPRAITHNSRLIQVGDAVASLFARLAKSLERSCFSCHLICARILP